MARKLAAVVFSMGCLQAGQVMALGLGELNLESFLNEPLKASVDLLNTGGLHEDEIKVRLATREDFDKMGLERAYFLTNITFDVEIDDNGRAQIILTSEEPVLEPYLDFIVEARWPAGRLLREYTVLIDPPVFEAGGKVSPVVSASEKLGAAEAARDDQDPAKKKTQGLFGSSAAAPGGTTVTVKQSDLAPGQMPQRDFNASAAGSPQPGGRYMISRDDTLWQIASRSRPQGVSVHQTMLDIQRLNPDAFINGNINRIKAGYIIQLPGADDISSDLQSALEEVKAQNEAWREGRDAELAASRGPALRISAEPEEEVAAADAAAVAGGGATGEGGAGAVPAAEAQAMEGVADGDLAAMQQQVQTLQRIVDLKDDQIAALQAALAEAEGRAPGELTGDVEGVDGAVIEGIDDTAMDDTAPETLDEGDGFAADDSGYDAEMIEDEAVGDDIAGEADATEQAGAEPTAPVAAVPEPAPAPKPAPKPAPVESGGGIMDNLLYIIGGLVVALIGFFLLRRRGGADDEEVVGEATFSDVKLSNRDMAIAQPDEDEDEDEAPARGTRGYGERKHDEYASDVEAADALAEADIYIAYGRHPQAVDLLNNALANEPNNPVYRLKLLEIYTELHERGQATAQFEKIQNSGNADAIAQAEAMMRRLDLPEEALESPLQPAADDARAPRTQDGPGLTPNPLEMMSDSTADDADFSGLEIEGVDSAADDLDLSSDFKQEADDEEELVIAADANGMSTKMDLARAYLDMGDDEGARQILEEVVAEGSEELQAEARQLLERIG